MSFPENNNFRKQKFLFMLTGVITGTVNGLFGGGGGSVVVPALKTIAGFPVKKAHATAILIILPVSAVSILFYLFWGGFSFPVTIPCAIGVSLGGLVGAKLLKKLSSPLVTVIFSLLMLAAGLKLLFF